MTVTILMVAGGILLLLGGGEFLVRGAVGLARSLGVPPLVIGMTVVAFGTSAPELVVSLQAALSGHEDIVLGNVVGSNIANLLLIVGVAAAIRSIGADSGAVQRQSLVVLVATLAFVGLCLFGSLESVAGLAMLLLLIGYTVWSFRSSRDSEAPEELETAPRSAVIAAAISLVGMAGVLVGARLLIDGAVEVARLAGLSEAVIGLTLIAFGTSLPELAAAGIAAWRGHGDLALGNALGSNLFNMLGIAGVTAIVTSVPVPVELLRFDLWAMLGVTVLCLLAARSGRRITRVEGGLLAAAYVVYIGMTVTPASFPL